jgi:hypothetical protein
VAGKQTNSLTDVLECHIINISSIKAFPECPSRLNVPEDLQKNSILIRCYAISGEDRSRPISYK